MRRPRLQSFTYRVPNTPARALSAHGTWIRTQGPSAPGWRNEVIRAADRFEAEQIASGRFGG